MMNGECGMMNVKKRTAFNSSFRIPHSSFLSLSDHSLLYLLQLAAHRAVVQRRADARHDAADQFVVNLELQAHSAARQLRELRAQSLLLVLRDWARGRHVRAHDPGASV